MSVVYLVLTDVWNTHCIHEVVGVYDTEEGAILAAKQYAASISPRNAACKYPYFQVVESDVNTGYGMRVWGEVLDLSE